MPKFVLQTLLLAASWHRFARQSALLEVMHIGILPDDLAGLFAQLGVKATETAPSANDAFSKTSNTLQGAEPVSGHQILLVDNDVVFTSGIETLCGLPSNHVYGAVAGTYRVTKKQWAHIAKLGLQPADCQPQIPRTAMVQAMSAGRPNSLTPLAFGYANGGVILFPAGYDFKMVWENQQRQIATAFDGHRLNSGSVTQSNMAALATCIGTYGKFDWLPPGYNFRHADFALGLCPASEICLVHMTGLGKRAEAAKLSDWIDEYWALKMSTGLGMLRGILSKDEMTDRMQQLEIVRETILSTIADYELDSLAAKLVNQISEHTGGEQAL